MKKNLVIGSEGFLGRPLCKYLEEKGEQVVRFDIKRGDEEDARTAMLPLQGVDRVYFLAWEVGGAKYLYREDTQLHQLNWNVDLLRNIMGQLQKSKTQFIFVSSQLAEDIDSIYGVTKKLGELWTQQLGGSCVRLWNIYGTMEEETERSHVVADFINQAKRTGTINMRTTGEERRQFVHVDDVCDGLHYVLDKNLNKDLYDLTSYEWISVRDVADIIAMHTKADVIPGNIKESVQKRSSVKGLPLGWVAKIRIEKGIERMIDEIETLDI